MNVHIAYDLEAALVVFTERILSFWRRGRSINSLKFIDRWN